MILLLSPAATPSLNQIAAMMLQNIAQIRITVLPSQIVPHTKQFPLSSLQNHPSNHKFKPIHDRPKLKLPTAVDDITFVETATQKLLQWISVSLKG